jgi:anti-sigma factor RsiW
VATVPTQHPEPGVLEAFALGRLGTVEMDRIAAHLADCPECARVVLAAPEDHIVVRLRRPAAGSSPDPGR